MFERDVFGFCYLFHDFSELHDPGIQYHYNVGIDDGEYMYSDEYFNTHNPFLIFFILERIYRTIYDLILRIDNEVSRMADEVYSQVISNINTQHTENDLFNFIHTNGNNLIGGVLGEAVPTAKDPKKRQYERLAELPDSEYAYIKK